MEKLERLKSDFNSVIQILAEMKTHVDGWDFG